MDRSSASRSSISIWCAIACAGLIVLSGAMAWIASTNKSPMYDEPDHTVSAYAARFQKAYQVDAQDPALFLRWAALFQSEDALHFNARDPRIAQRITQDENRWPLDIQALFRTPGVDGDAVIHRTRLAMLLAGLLTAIVIARWSWMLGGPVAAVCATVLYSLDPNFLAHAPLVKNDVASALMLMAAMAVTWSLGKKVTVRLVLLAGLVCAAAVCIKFSAIVLGLLVPGLLIGRALLPRPWIVLRREVDLRKNKVFAAIGIVAFIGVFSCAFIWACYGFRYTPTPDGNVAMDMKWVVMSEMYERARARSEPPPASWEQALDRAPASIRAALWVDAHHLLPQAWTYGLLFQSATTHFRRTFLLGNVSLTGWWYYFPMAMLFKTPTATIAIAALAPIALVVRRKRMARDLSTMDEALFDGWTLACVGAPVIVYALAAMANNLNLGIRHVLPLYPFLYIGLGVALAKLLSGASRTIWTMVIALGAALLIETCAAWPNYLAFFNFPSGGSRGGLALLSDSNLDWGQDLKLLAHWQRENPTRRLYLRYFGTADPEFYGVRYINLPGGYPFGPAAQLPSEPGVIAISVTHLQGVYDDAKLHALYEPLRHATPLAVLGGTIYLFEYPLTGR